MNKFYASLIALTIPAAMSAQSAFDIYRFSQSEIRGTARFMSMGGAFTALGGDLSSLSQNPAGIGVYRRSEIGATLDISPRSIAASSPLEKHSVSSTTVNCNNFGYVGSISLKGIMETFSWGATYNRVASFNRKFNAKASLSTSLSNYVADFSNSAGYVPGDLNITKTFNPYYEPYKPGYYADWLAILSNSLHTINYDSPENGFRGLWQEGTTGDAYADMKVHETGYVDEYNIDFGGNIDNKLMWGLGFGITDLQFNSTAYYNESMEGANVPTPSGETTTGKADFSISNYRAVSGTGFNIKLGIIYKPINELRIGVAFHTPTWYNLSTTAYADGEYKYSYSDRPEWNNNKDYIDTPDDYYNFRLTSPWKVMVGVAGVIGSSAIVSADYEYQAYNKMSSRYQDYMGSYVADEGINADIREYYKAAHIFRVGAEYRLSDSFSVRAGYNYTSSTTSNYLDDSKGKHNEARTTGTNPAYTYDGGTHAVSAGIGYRYKGFYADAAYVYRNHQSTYKPFTSYGQIESPSVKLSESINSIVLSVGIKF